MAESSTNQTLVPDLVAGSLHLRVIEDGSSRSNTMDFAMLVKSVLDAGGSAVVASDSNMSDMFAAVGYGWREPRLGRIRATSLLSVLDGWYRHTADGATPVLFIEDATHLTASSVSASDVTDADVTDLLVALCAGDEARLFELTGLDRNVMLRSKRLAELNPAAVVAGVHRRRSYSPKDTAGLVADPRLVQQATTISTLGQPSRDGDMVVTDGCWLKNRNTGTTGPVELQRPLETIAAWSVRT